MIDLIPSMEKYVRNTGNIFLALLDLGKKKKRKRSNHPSSSFSFSLPFFLFVHLRSEEETVIIWNVTPCRGSFIERARFSHDRRAFHQREGRGGGLGFYRTAFRRECLVERGRGVFLEPTSPKTRDFWETPSSPDPPW